MNEEKKGFIFWKEGYAIRNTTHENFGRLKTMPLESHFGTFPWPQL